MRVNNYDDVAIKRAVEFATGGNTNHEFIEKPTMYGLIPEIKGKKVLCIGCGTGEECAELVRRGADVLAIDSSKVSIEYAREHVPDARFLVMDMDDAALADLIQEGPFSLIYSSLAVHYSNDLEKLFQTCKKLLEPGGYLIYSTGHPVKWASETYRDPQDAGKKSHRMGYIRNGNNVEVWGNYLQTIQQTHSYPDGLVQQFWTRPPSAHFALLKQAGFMVTDFLEPAPMPAAEHVDPALWGVYTKLPCFMMYKAQVI
jgi:SAM-dependent methyltransferase